MEEETQTMTEPTGNTQALPDINVEPPSEDVEPKTIPIERFNQVYGQYKAYKDLGKPEEIVERLQRLDAYEKQLATYRNQKTSEDPKAEILQQAIDVGLATKADIEERFQRIAKTNLISASRYLTGIMEKENIKLTPELQDEVEDYLWTRMNEDERSAIMYGDFLVINTIVKKSLTDGLLSKLKALPPPPPPPPKRHGSGGIPPKPAKEGPKTWKDADDEAWSLIKGG